LTAQALRSFSAKERIIMSKETTFGILGDITPKASAHDTIRRRGANADDGVSDDVDGMNGGSQHGSSEHAGTREITEGVTGGLGTEVGGTRNYRQGTGHTGGDIGNRVE
jgi:hypothetical protein